MTDEELRGSDLAAAQRMLDRLDRSSLIVDLRQVCHAVETWAGERREADQAVFAFCEQLRLDAANLRETGLATYWPVADRIDSAADLLERWWRP